MIGSIILLIIIAGMVAYLVYGVQKNKKAQAEVKVEAVKPEVKKPKGRPAVKPKATQAAKPKATVTKQNKNNKK